MDTNALREFAHEVANQTIAANWQLWTLLLAAAAVTSFFASLLAAYAAKLGQNLATKADFEEILRQARLTTQEVENIRSEISFGEWTAKEYRSLRRVKLEELLLTAYDSQQWLLSEHNRVVFKSSVQQEAPEQAPSPITKTVMLGGLYFPELRKEIRALQQAHDSWVLWLRQWREDLLKANIDTPDVVAFQAKRLELVGKTRDQIKASFTPVVDAVRTLQRSAEALMCAIVGSTNTTRQ
jgi:hypothetical protein